MKRLILITAAMLLILSAFATQQNIRLDSGRTESVLLSKSNSGVEIEYDIAELNWFEVQTNKGSFVELSVPDYTSSRVFGSPKLPMERKIIEVPLDATVVPSIKVISSRVFNLSDYGIASKIIPSQPPVPKSADHSLVDFVVNESAYTEASLTHESIRVKELGIMRNARLFAVDYYPISYNPVNGEVTVITEAIVEVDYLNGNMTKTRELKERTNSFVFDSVINKSTFATLDVRTSLDRYPLGYIIVTPNNFVNTLQPFIDWKTEQGFQVTVATTEAVGTTTTAISNYIESIWDSATADHPAPSYLLIVGDVAQVPAFNGQTGSHITDLNYVRLEGTDYIPEMYFGRFSAQNVNQLQPQVDKTVMYEKYLMSDPSYLDDVTLIAGIDSNYGSSHGNGTINYGSQNYYNTAHGINANVYLYPSSGNSDAAIIQDVSDGVGFINYTAHGDNEEWYDPQFNNNDVFALTNSEKYTFAIGNCCLTNHFQTDTCFGEAWLRAEDKGAVIYIGGTNSTYWDEDYHWSVGNKPIAGGGTPWIPNHVGVYDGLFHEHNEAMEDWVTTAGSMTFMGNMAVAEGNGSDDYYWEIYSIMGDPSLSPYIGVPADNQAIIPSQIFIGQQAFDVFAAPNSYISLTKAGDIVATGLADATGYLNLTLPGITEACDVKLVSTGYGYQPFEGTIQVIPNDGAYLNVPNFTINQATSINAGTQMDIDIEVANIGNLAVSGVTATLTSVDPYVTINNNICSIASVDANSSETVTGAFTITVSGSVPDEHNLSFNVSMGDHNDVWQSTAFLTANAPEFTLSNMQVNDNSGDGALDAGEGATITFNLNNSGHMVANATMATFVINNPDVTVAGAILDVGVMGIGANNTLSFPIQLSADYDAAALVFGVSVVAECGSYVENFLVPVGMSGDNFETGDFSMLNWTFSGNTDWAINTADVHDGNYSVKSGSIGSNQNSTMSLSVDLAVAGEISFFYKVSSEDNYDWLEFYDGSTRVQRWSGTSNWTEFTYNATAGNHNFSWKYVKDWSDTGGSDCAWIDDVVLPGGATGGTSMPIFSCATDEIEYYNVPANEELSRDLIIQNAGNDTLTGSLIMPDGFTLEGSQNYSIEAGGSQIFRVLHTAAIDEDITAEITVNSNDPFYSTHTVNIMVATNTVGNDDNELPVVTALTGNYPNPFNPETSISFSIKETGDVRVDVYNIKGQRINTLVDEVRNAGAHTIVWKGLDYNNRKVASGVYFYRMDTKGYTKTKKMLLMK